MASHLITLKDWSGDDIRQVVQEGIALKQDPTRGRGALTHRTLALLFQKTSTRTRCSGEIGMSQLGGQAIYLDWRASNFGLADLGDEIRVLSSYVDFIVARLLHHEDLKTVAAAASVPVMNGCCDRYHPLQILADLQTVQEKLGRLEGVRLTYAGVHNNVAEADYVYTDTWLDMEYFDNPDFAEEKERRLALLRPYQLNRSVLEGVDALIMHCLPAHRGYEIEGELIDDPRSVLFDQAENRLHSQKAALLKLA